MNRFYYLNYLLFKALAFCIFACIEVKFWIMDSLCLRLVSYESWTMCVELVWLDSEKIKLSLNLLTNNPMFP
jgi:hypothetical protein